MHVGDALDGLKQTSGDFDLIFNNIDKAGYPAVLEVAPQRLRRGEVLITDNALWNGTVLRPTDAVSQAVVEFNRKLSDRKDFIACLLPLRDGVSVAIKL